MSKALSTALRCALAIAGPIALAGIAPAWAHHSHAMFNLELEETIKGNVKSFVFTNPHIYLYVDVADKESAAVKTYIVEMSHVQNMMSRGIRASTFKAGDPVVVTLNPLRDGRPGGNYVSVVTQDGKKYGGREEAAADAARNP